MDAADSILHSRTLRPPRRAAHSASNVAFSAHHRPRRAARAAAWCRACGAAGTSGWAWRRIRCASAPSRPAYSPRASRPRHGCSRRVWHWQSAFEFAPRAFAPPQAGGTCRGKARVGVLARAPSVEGARARGRARGRGRPTNRVSGLNDAGLEWLTDAIGISNCGAGTGDPRGRVSLGACLIGARLGQRARQSISPRAAI